MFNPVGCEEVCSIQWDAYVFVVTVQRVLFEHLTTWVAARGRCSFHIPELSKGAVRSIKEGYTDMSIALSVNHY